VPKLANPTRFGQIRSNPTSRGSRNPDLGPPGPRSGPPKEGPDPGPGGSENPGSGTGDLEAPQFPEPATWIRDLVVLGPTLRDLGQSGPPFWYGNLGIRQKRVKKRPKSAKMELCKPLIDSPTRGKHPESAILRAGHSLIAFSDPKMLEISKISGIERSKSSLFGCVLKIIF